MSIKKNNVRVIPSICFLILFGCGAANAQSKTDKIDELLSTNYRNGILNGTVLVAEYGKVIFKKAYGFADMEWNVPNELDTKYNLASVTKQFVAMLVLQQVEKGTLKLEGKVSDYLPDYPKTTGKHITIHHLLSHTSGIPNYTESPNFDQIFSRTTYPTPESFVSVFADSSLEFEPGTKYTYDNSGYFLLGVILEKVTGQPYARLLQEHILTPLGMTHSGMDDQISLLPKRAIGYNRGFLANTHAGYWDRSSLYTAGGMYSTVGDLLLWDQALYTDILLPKKFRDLLFTPSIPIDSSTAYGYGWFLKRTALNGGDSVSVIYHTGTITGFNALIYRIPATQRTFICLNNMLVGRDHLIAMAKSCMNILYEKQVDLPRPSLAAHLGSIITKDGIEAASKEYMQLKNKSDRYALNEEEMNTLAYELLHRKKTKEAIEILKLNVSAFPKSSNAYDSLGEAYMNNGDTDLAISNYKKSIELDPKNTAGLEKLKKLQSK